MQKYVVAKKCPTSDLMQGLMVNLAVDIVDCAQFSKTSKFWAEWLAHFKSRLGDKTLITARSKQNDNMIVVMREGIGVMQVTRSSRITDPGAELSDPGEINISHIKPKKSNQSA